jgi:hypothetical protein
MKDISDHHLTVLGAKDASLSRSGKQSAKAGWIFLNGATAHHRRRG